jgi:DNA-directed RNA polymerase specialized sigma24 family protein
MAKAAPLTIEQREAIADLRGERGWTIDKIAEHLGVSHGAVSYRCLIDGIERAGHSFPKPSTGPLVVTRGAFQVRRFTPDEDDRLIGLEAEGLSHAAIGRRLGRRANSVKGRLATLARRDERALAQPTQGDAA